MRLLSLIVLTTCAGCYADAEGLFADDRAAVACSDAVPVCSTFAGCVLDETNYTQGSFAQGATRRVVVRTSGAASIEVGLFFASQGSPGLDTEIAWNEVGCRDRHVESSDGADVFAEAGAERVWKRAHRVSTAGDHLVEVFSDAQAEYLLRVSVVPEG